jgi:hypothetical protein
MDKPKVGFPVFMTHIRGYLHDTSSAGQRRAKTDSTLGRTAGLPDRPSHAYIELVGKPGGKRPLGRYRRRWEDTKMDPGSGGMDWIHLAQYRDQWRALVNTVMNLRTSGRLL